jgi:hypothetical protein
MIPFRVKQQDMNFVFITNYYDGPLSGFCLWDNQLHRFEATDESYGDDEYDVYPLTLWEKIKAKTNQKAFEICVGTHWSYGGNKRKSHFYWRRPNWLHKLLFDVYYKLTMKR